MALENQMRRGVCREVGAGPAAGRTRFATAGTRSMIGLHQSACQPAAGGGSQQVSNSARICHRGFHPQPGSVGNDAGHYRPQESTTKASRSQQS